jgi:hypothetical protein
MEYFICNVLLKIFRGPNIFRSDEYRHLGYWSSYLFMPDAVNHNGHPPKEIIYFKEITIIYLISSYVSE